MTDNTPSKAEGERYEEEVPNAVPAPNPKGSRTPSKAEGERDSEKNEDNQ
jgi:hypothetical protein